MQTYKISTLGQGFLFVNRTPSENEMQTRVIRSSGSRAARTVEIQADMKYDYAAFADTAAAAFEPDLFRAVLAFLYEVRGLPRSEYEILVNGTRLMRTQGHGKIGGNVGKCKLLFSKRIENSESGDATFYFVEAPQGNYVFVCCDNPAVADMRRITSRAISWCEGIPSLRGSLALAFSDGRATVRFHPLDNSALADTSVYAAAAFLILELFGERCSVIENGELMAQCEADGSQVSVYDLRPTAHKLN